MQYEQPTVIFKDEDIRGIGLCPVHLVARSGSDAFQTRDPCCGALNLDGDFRNVDAHERCVAKDLFPAGSDIFPTCYPVPVRMNTYRAGVRCPHFVHQIDIEAFQGKVKLEVNLDDLLRIGHKESSIITSFNSDATCNIHNHAFRFRARAPHG
jgi:hypothetical protein